MKIALYAAAIVCLLAVGASALWVASSVSLMRQDLDATEESLAATVESARADLAVTEAELASQLSTTALQFTKEVHVLRGDVSRSLSKADVAIADLVKIREDLRRPLEATAAALDETEATLRNFRNLSDDFYPDVRALVESATIATTSTAHVTQEVQRVAPATLDNVRDTSKNVKRMTSWPMVLAQTLIKAICKLKFW